MKLQNFQPEKYFDILNLGNPAMCSLDNVLSSISKHLKKDFRIQNLDLQKGDILQTQCDFSKVSNLIGEFEFTELDLGILEFVNWYRREGFKYVSTK
jgi:UDP-glucose 4-epimerase